MKPLSPVIPVFFLIALGFTFARWKKISLASVTEIIVYLGTPSLVFTSLASKPLYAGELVILFSGILLIYAGVGFLIQLYFLVFRFHSRGFALPVLFMNAGNMGLPLALFAFGQAGMQRAPRQSSGPRASRLHCSSEHVHVRADHPHRVLAHHVTQGEKEKKPKNS